MQKHAPALVFFNSAAKLTLSKKVISPGPAAANAATPSILLSVSAFAGGLAPVNSAIWAIVSGVGVGKKTGSAIDSARRTRRAAEIPTAPPDTSYHAPRISFRR
jgi:hypothetical protein